MSVDLLVAPCSYKAAKFAVMNWHYSKAMPAGKLVKFGVWEDGAFVGAVLFGWGAIYRIGDPYSLKMTEVCELVRVALTSHKSAVSQIVAKAIKELCKQSPGLRLIVSYADPEQGHNGAIYQAMNWVYVGSNTSQWKIVNGVKLHPRSIYSRYGTHSLEFLKKHIDKNASITEMAGKYKYLYPLDKAMRRQIEPLAQPYPKRADVGEIESRFSTTE